MENITAINRTEKVSGSIFENSRRTDSANFFGKILSDYVEKLSGASAGRTKLDEHYQALRQEIEHSREADIEYKKELRAPVNIDANITDLAIETIKDINETKEIDDFYFQMNKALNIGYQKQSMLNEFDRNAEGELIVTSVTDASRLATQYQDEALMGLNLRMSDRSAQTEQLIRENPENLLLADQLRRECREADEKDKVEVSRQIAEYSLAIRARL
ncbi:hypothetical protein [Zhongshania marina]|uniref:Uncharacterized protein n=1 Tax=Zhongshania marina TaxID=2304603 RepID=A0ABX9W1S6_9GAMM|nr:hypothetical protein D0911_11320 [Zhongshania marina]